MLLDDTIVAPITGLTKAAVAVVRLSGPEAWSIAAQLFQPFPEIPESHRVTYGRVAEDDGLLTLFADGRSYTGDQTAEISIHGSPASLGALVYAAIRQGARLAEPGEFTYRAFANGRFDLTQAEAVRDTVEAETKGQLIIANSTRSGALRVNIGGVRDSLITVLAHLEALVDFSEELGEPDLAQWGDVLQSAGRIVDGFLATAESGRIMRRGLRIAILGRPNAGKSSLLNALLQADRAIVSEIPGTTRDYIEEKADLGGIPCVLLDTAGLRTTEDVVEGLGVERSRRLATDADLVWYVYDAKAGWQSEDDAELARFDDPIILGAKSDLAEPEKGLAVSSVTRQGLDELIASVRDRVGAHDLYVQERHVEPLNRAKEAIRLAAECIEHDQPFDLISTALREAIHALGEITGETASEDMIERIFADFCIGK
jgi:tRNA modification GTPase